jgi:hypothetical protein
MQNRSTSNNHFRHHMYQIIFEADTPGGKAFDVAFLSGTFSVSLRLTARTALLKSTRSMQRSAGTAAQDCDWDFLKEKQQTIIDVQLHNNTWPFDGTKWRLQSGANSKNSWIVSGFVPIPICAVIILNFELMRWMT